MRRKENFTERVAVVIPVYKNELTALEELALKQCFRVLNKHKIIIIKPKSLQLTILKDHKFIEYISFEDEYFKDLIGYNRLMLWEGFYEKFLKFQYILIYQMDAFVFTDRLIEWCDKGYDYIGAPWLRSHKYIDIVKAVKSKILIAFHTRFNIKQPGTDLPTEIQFENKVGNGGLSLRKVRKFYELSVKYKSAQLEYIGRKENHFNEDVWWSIELNRKKRHLKIPGYKTAVRFSFENEPRRAYELTGHKLPFGCHAWNRHLDFWRGKIVIGDVFDFEQAVVYHLSPPLSYPNKRAPAKPKKIKLAPEYQFMVRNKDPKWSF